MQLVPLDFRPAANDRFARLAANQPPGALDPMCRALLDGVTIEAANDCTPPASPEARAELEGVDLNGLIGRVVGEVTGRAGSGAGEVRLSLDPARPRVDGDAVALAFALSGILIAQLRALDECDEGVVHVETRGTKAGASVTITTDGVPPLGFVRAITGVAGSGDPTLAHCRRLVEAQGGRMTLAEEGGRIGLRVELPPVPPTRVVSLLAAKRRPPTHTNAGTGSRLAA